MSLMLPSDPYVGQVVVGSDGNPAAAFTRDGWAFFVGREDQVHKPKPMFGESPKPHTPVKHFGPMGWLEQQVEEICVLGRSAI